VGSGKWEVGSGKYGRGVGVSLPEAQKFFALGKFEGSGELFIFFLLPTPYFLLPTLDQGEKA